MPEMSGYDVLRQMTRIDPNVPIMYLCAGKMFPESIEYKKKIIERLSRQLNRPGLQWRILTRLGHL